MDHPVTAVVTISVPEDKKQRALELWTILVADIKSTEKGQVKLDLYFNEASGNYVVIETFASEEDMARYNKKPLHLEVGQKVKDEGVAARVDFIMLKGVLGTGMSKP